MGIFRARYSNKLSVVKSNNHHHHHHHHLVAVAETKKRAVQLGLSDVQTVRKYSLHGESTDKCFFLFLLQNNVCGGGGAGGRNIW